MTATLRRRLPLPLLLAGLAPAQYHWVEYAGSAGPGVGRHVVLVSGDEEYRSEEALPQLAAILARHHGFHCTVLFAIDRERGIVQPNLRTDIPGLESLADAQVMVIATRFRDLPDEQMAHIDAYLKRGGAVLGMRTATHAFQIGKDRAFAHYANGYAGERSEWHGGFGRLVLGEQWISHHGHHGRESTRGVIPDAARDHAIARGLGDGSAIWGPTDVYGVRLPLPGDSQPLVLGQVVDGMTPDAPAVEGAKNDPMLPVAWTRTYALPGGEHGKVFTTTMGAATDLASEGTRRLLVHAVYWLAGIGEQIPADGAVVDLVGDYRPSPFAFHDDQHWLDKGLRPEDYELLPQQLAPPAVEAAARGARDEDVASIDAIVAALYASISGPVGAARDFDRMRHLFADGARLIPSGPRAGGGFGHAMLSVDDYIERSGTALVRMGFTEREIARRVDRFGNVAHVFSTYEALRGEEIEPFLRGINSIQLTFDGERWWVLNVFWQQESPRHPIPAQYLR